MKKGVGSGVGSGSISKRYGFGDTDPDPHQNVTDPQHWLADRCSLATRLYLAYEKHCFFEFHSSVVWKLEEALKSGQNKIKLLPVFFGRKYFFEY